MHTSSIYDTLIEDYESNPQKSISSISIQSDGTSLIRNVRTSKAQGCIIAASPGLCLSFKSRNSKKSKQRHELALDI